MLQSITPTLGINLRHLLERIMLCYIVLSVVELVLFPSFDVFIGLVFSFMGIYATSQYLCYKEKMYYYPVSSISLLFYCLYFEILPLPATLMELKPITFNMHNPIETFFQLLFLHFWLIIIHYIYMTISARENILRNFWIKCNFYVRLTASEMWFLIYGSSLWYVYKMINYGLYTEDSLNINSSFTISQWMIDLFFSTYYQILFIFYFKKFGIIKGSYKINHLFIIIVSIILFVIGIGTNMRTAATIVYANALFTLIIYSIYYSDLHFSYRFRYIAFFLMVLLLFKGPIQIISSAMIAVRGDRAGKDAIEILKMTINSNSNWHNEHSEKNKHAAVIWDEYYLDNHFLNRFCSLKILDESLYHAHRAGFSNNMMRTALFDKLGSMLPRIIRPNNAKTVIHGSLSDFLYALSTHKATHMGGVRIGTLQGLGLVLFGYAYPLVLVPIYIILFFMLDSLCIQRKGKIFFSLIFFVGIVNYAGFFSDQHYYVTQVRMIIRTFWENSFFYLISIKIVKRLPLIQH